jgi:toxin ParE1/3/4
MRLTYHPEAEAELVEAAEFYESRSPSLGEGFLREFDAAIAEVQKYPVLWTLVEGDLRCHTIRRFPFSI